MSFEKPKFQPQTMPKDEFFAKALPLTADQARELGLGKKEQKSGSEKFEPRLATTWSNPETGQEQEISFDLEQEIAFFRELYQKDLGIELDQEKIISIWNQNYAEIKGEVEKYGYDNILIIPDKLPTAEVLNQKLIETMEETKGGQKKKVATTYQSDNFKQGGSFNGVKSSSEPSSYRIILNHGAQNIYDNQQANPYLKATLNQNIMDLTGFNQSEVNQRIANNQELPVNFEAKIKKQKVKIQSEGLSLADYLVAQKAFFAKTGHHLDEKGWTWLLKSSSGSRVVDSRWRPDDRRLRVFARDPGLAVGNLGLRLSRSFKLT